MDKRNNDSWSTVQAVVARYDEGARIHEILEGFADAPPRRTLQYWLKRWVEQGLLRRTGERRGVRYFLV